MNTTQKTNKKYQMITDNIIDNLIDNKPITNYQKRVLLFLFKSNKINQTDFYFKIGYHKLSNKMNKLVLDLVNIDKTNDIIKNINKSITFYQTINLDLFFIRSNIDKLTNNISLLLQTDYLYNIGIIKNDLLDLDFYLNQYIDLFNDKKDNINDLDKNSDLHKFITQIDLFKLFDKLNKSNYISYNNTNNNDLKSYFINNIGLICVKIDYDLLKCNQYKFNNVNHFKIVVYNYDSTNIYYILNKNDLIDLNLKYSYDFNNLLSYMLDLSIVKYYDIFNDKKQINKGFKYIKTFDNVLNKQINNNKINNRVITTNLDKNNKYCYSNDYKTFNDILDSNLTLKYLNIDLDKRFKQFDLDLISIDNDKDYNLYLDYINNYLIDLSNDLDFIKNNLFNDSYDIINDFIDLEFYNDLDLDLDLIVSYFNDYYKNIDLNNKLDKIDNDIIDIKNDINLLNQIIDIIDLLYKDLDKNNTLYNTLKDINKEKLNKHNTKNNNNDLAQIKNGTKNYCYIGNYDKLSVV